LCVDKDCRDLIEGELKSRRGCKTCDRLQLAKQDMNLQPAIHKNLFSFLSLDIIAVGLKFAGDLEPTDPFIFDE
jgi:hypothetical protein